MPKKKYAAYDSDEEFQSALENPNAIIHYNIDETYSIEYKEPSPEPVEEENKKDIGKITFDIHDALLDYCEEEMIPLLDYCQHEHIIALVNSCIHNF